jgi:thioredoxin reductase
LKKYTTVQLEPIEVTDAKKLTTGFEITLENDEKISCKKLLIATGVVDELPQIPSFHKFYGRSIFHCPYCDGWEFRDQPAVTYGRGKRGHGLAMKLRGWTNRITLCSDGPSQLSAEEEKELSQDGIRVMQNAIEELEGKNGALKRIRFVDGKSVECAVMFFSTGQHQRSDLAEKLGCELADKGMVHTGKYESTNVRGLFVAGDASEEVQLAILAAAEGAKAAFAINTALLEEEK